VQQARITGNSNAICLLLARYLDPEDGGCKSLRNVGKLLDYSVTQQKNVRFIFSAIIVSRFLLNFPEIMVKWGLTPCTLVY
jgi:hypothetical protein